MRTRVLLTLAVLATPVAAQDFAPDAIAFYEDQVKPVLRRNCVACHNAKNRTSGFSLASREHVLEGGNRGPGFSPEAPASSVLLKAVQHESDLKMPPTGKLKDADLAVLTRWVEMGLPWPKTEVSADFGKPKHWAFQPVRQPEPPGSGHAIDAFILKKLRENGIQPSPEADRATLLRRVSFDLTGLPPTSAEVDAFLKDPSQDAYEKAVDRMLASPQYGERWARHWLDLARYADSNGYNLDHEREIWKYRDWVIEAYNRDMPFDRFVIEQIAGDLLPEPTEDRLVATGFHRNTLLNLEGGIDFEQYRVDAVADRVDTTGAVFLGLTLGCARCHDHKYDPISQREYYQLYAFFNNIDELSGEWGEAGRRRAHEPLLFFGTSEEKAKKAAIRAQLAALEAELNEYKKALDPNMAEWEDGLTADEKAKLRPDIQFILSIPRGERNEIMTTALGGVFYKTDPGYQQRQEAIRAVSKLEPKLTSTMIMRELPEPRPAFIHLGGDFLRPGIGVRPDVPRALPALARQDRAPNRLDLAQWLVDPANPLTARVTVNRVWQRLFGRGLVDTENDFGTQGSKPTHPELLDWLAAEFAGDWSQKKLIRRIVTSAAYKQSSKARPELSDRDPYNELIARQSRLRLEAEIVRDAALAASGLLHLAVGGKSVFPPQPKGASKLGQVQRDIVVSDGPDKFRRGMYTHFWRSAPDPNLMVFDAPDTTTTCTRRSRSNTPLQALTLLNDEGYFEMAGALAARMTREVPEGGQARLRHGFRLCMAREPEAEEVARLERFFKQQLDAAPEDESRAWLQVARVFLNLDEFITRE
ncbi:MAG: PSD1 domain-containing protein [Bryobacterales bacterium]|nr:PSD1 domain-containing protein [Bryobacterales bacterium]